MTTVICERLPHGLDLPLPAYASAGAAGLDLYAAVAAMVTLPPLGRALVPTGVALALPPGMEGQIRPRSGLAIRQGLTVLNAPGTVDSDYRGELQVILINLSDVPVSLQRGDRIAQLVIAPAPQAVLVEASVAADTARGVAGFGSTGR